MRAEASRIYEMGTRVASFSDAQPDTDQSHVLSVAKVKEVVAQMQVVAGAQRAGLIDAAAGAAEQQRLRRAILSGAVTHLAEVGRRASREEHELGRAFRYKPGTQTFLAFHTSARAMQSEAEAHKGVLLKYGLSEPVLEQLGQSLDRFDAAVLLANNGRTAHKGATKQLDRMASEIRSVVRVMDARNRQRFQDNPQLLASWISASTVLGSKRGMSAPAETPEPAPDGAARPAA
jgi:hypothetical protein